MLHNETFVEGEPYEIFNPEFVWKRKKITDYYTRELAVPIFESGKLVYDLPSTEQIRDYCKEQLDTLWQEVQRFENPHTYYVDLSDKLWTLKQELIEGHKDF